MSKDGELHPKTLSDAISERGGNLDDYNLEHLTEEKEHDLFDLISDPSLMSLIFLILQ